MPVGARRLGARRLGVGDSVSGDSVSGDSVSGSSVSGNLDQLQCPVVVGVVLDISILDRPQH